MKVSIELRKKAKDKSVGVLNLRISDKGKNRYKSLKIEVPTKYWNSNIQKVKSNYKDAKKINTVLESEIYKYNFSGVKALENSDVSIIEYFKKEIEFYKYSTKMSYSYPVKTFEKYLISVNKEHLKLEELTFDILRGFLQHIESKGTISQNTIKTIFFVLKALVNKAIDLDRVNYYRHPFKGIKLKYSDFKSEFLNKNELEKFLNYKGDRYRMFTKSIFLFSVATQGIRFSDVCLLKYSGFEFKEGYLYVNVITLKNKKGINIKMNSLSLKQLPVDVEEYESEYTNEIEFLNKVLNGDNTNLSERKMILFNEYSKDLEAVKNRLNVYKELLLKEKHLKYWEAIQKKDKNQNVFFPTKFVNYKPGSDLNESEFSEKQSLVNNHKDRLKDICRAVSIKEITFHCARHTYSMLMANSGMGIEELSESLKHYSINTTKAYLHKLQNNSTINKKTAEVFNNF